jgi:hypothetical protein
VTTIAHDRLQHDRRNPTINAAVYCIFQQLQAELHVSLNVQAETWTIGIGMWHAGEPRLDGQKRIVRMRPAGSHRRDRTTMIGILQHDDVLSARTVLVGELDRHFHREAAMQRVADTVKVTWGDVAQL